MFSLTNKVAVITGAGSGIGKSIALLFARQGAIVHVIEADKLAVDQVLKEIASCNAFAHFCDVSDQKKVVDVLKRIGRIDILVNNAGIAHIGKADTTSEESFDRVYQINVKGVYNCLYGALPLMKVNGGVILNMASVASHVGLEDRFAYSMSKGAIYSMSMSVARDYLANNIRCNSISPARVHTPFVDGFIAKNYPHKQGEMFEALSKSQPIGRMGKPIEVAALALFLCSDEAGFITGCDYPIDGGFITLNN